MIINANVITLDPARPCAHAVAIANQTILDVGSTGGILKHATKETRVVDLHGKTVVPGLIDSHVHMLDFGLSLQQLDLRNVTSIKELQANLEEGADDTPSCKWVSGGKWDQERLTEKRYPNRWDLDAAVNDKPVFLLRVCGHIGVANSKALELAGINRETAHRVDGVDRDESTGEPTGILREGALQLIRRVMPNLSLKEVEESCKLACRRAVEAGLTSVNWLLSSADELRAIHKLHSKGELPVRIYLGIPARLQQNLAELGLITGFGNDMVRIGFVKVLVDGSLGGHTAALNKAYSDRQDTKGMMLYTQRKLNKIVFNAHRAELQLAIHAIGDRAIEATLKALMKGLRRLPRENHRHRIEHCSVLNSVLIKRMKRLGVVASVQPHFTVSDFWVLDRLGKERTRSVYPFKSLLQTGIVVAAGSDCPVEPIDPLLGMWASVARKDSYGENITPEEALKMYTLHAAYASFCEDKKGSVEVGKYADLTVLSDDPRSVPAEKIKDITIEMVITDGKVVYSRG